MEQDLDLDKLKFCLYKSTWEHRVLVLIVFLTAKPKGSFVQLQDIQAGGHLPCYW